jgi:hypothetical protein
MPILNSTLQSTLHIYELHPSLIHSQTIDLLKTINLSILVSEEVISLNGLTSLSRSEFCFFQIFRVFLLFKRLLLDYLANLFRHILFLSGYS